MCDSLSRLFYSLAGFYADAHRDNEKRFIISVDEKLTASLLSSMTLIEIKPHRNGWIVGRAIP